MTHDMSLDDCIEFCDGYGDGDYLVVNDGVAEHFAEAYTRAYRKKLAGFIIVAGSENTRMILEGKRWVESFARPVSRIHRWENPVVFPTALGAYNERDKLKRPGGRKMFLAALFGICRQGPESPEAWEKERMQSLIRMGFNPATGKFSAAPLADGHCARCGTPMLVRSSGGRAECERCNPSSGKRKPSPFRNSPALKRSGRTWRG